MSCLLAPRGWSPWKLVQLLLVVACCMSYVTSVPAGFANLHEDLLDCKALCAAGIAVGRRCRCADSRQLSASDFLGASSALDSYFNDAYDHGLVTSHEAMANFLDWAQRRGSVNGGWSSKRSSEETETDIPDTWKSVFRWGKRGSEDGNGGMGSVFRWGKRGLPATAHRQNGLTSVFRWGKRQAESSASDPHSADSDSLDSLLAAYGMREDGGGGGEDGVKRSSGASSVFRWGKRSGEAQEQEQGEGVRRRSPSVFRWGKRSTSSEEELGSGLRTLLRWNKKLPTRDADYGNDGYRIFRWGKRRDGTHVFRWGKKKRDLRAVASGSEGTRSAAPAIQPKPRDTPSE